MDFREFKDKYQKVPVVEYPNKRKGKKPLVTVKVVTYNHSGYIRQCLDSVLMQKTNFDYEILIAEDESNDGTREICIEYAEKHPDKIRLFFNSRKNNIHINGNPTGIFNNAYANYNLHSKYSCLIEGDDYWVDESSLQKRVDFLEKNEEYILCFHNIKIVQNGQVINDRTISFKKDTEVKSEEMLNAFIPTNTIMQRNFVTNYFDHKLEGIVCGDMVTRAKLSLHGKAMYLNDIKCSVYRRHVGGVFGLKDFSYKLHHTIVAANYIYEYFKAENKSLKSASKNLIYNYWIYCLLDLKDNKRINYRLFKEGYRIARLHQLSFLSIILDDLQKRIKNKLVS